MTSQHSYHSSPAFLWVHIYLLLVLCLACQPCDYSAASLCGWPFPHYLLSPIVPSTPSPSLLPVDVDFYYSAGCLSPFSLPGRRWCCVAALHLYHDDTAHTPSFACYLIGNVCYGDINSRTGWTGHAACHCRHGVCSNGDVSPNHVRLHCREAACIAPLCSCLPYRQEQVLCVAFSYLFCATRHFICAVPFSM